MIFNIDSAMKHSYSNDDTCFSIDVIDEILKEYFDALLDEGSKILHSIERTLLKEEIFVESNEFMAMTTDINSDSESDTKDPPFKKITINTDYKIKTSLKEPPTDLELKPLLDNLEYFIKDFLKIARPLTKLLEKDTPFEFDDECQKAFELLKEKLMCSYDPMKNDDGNLKEMRLVDVICNQRNAKRDLLLQWIKKAQEKDKIGSKLDKNGKRSESVGSIRRIQSMDTAYCGYGVSILWIWRIRICSFRDTIGSIVTVYENNECKAILSQ
nr:reverse transcriptase domain-containing protein [Tanacetum cinerariifolium]